MKFETNFEEFKKAITTCGKGLKKGALLTPLIKIEAKEHSLIVSENNISGNGIGIEVTIPATVEKTGSFVTSFYSANVLSIRNCTGKLEGELVGNMLVLKYKNGLAKTVLTKMKHRSPMLHQSRLMLQAQAFRLMFLAVC